MILEERNDRLFNRLLDIESGYEEKIIEVLNEYYNKALVPIEYVTEILKEVKVNSYVLVGKEFSLSPERVRQIARLKIRQCIYNYMRAR